MLSVCDSNSSINGTESVYGYSVYFFSLLSLVHFHVVNVHVSVYVSIFVNIATCVRCVHYGHTALYLFIPQTLPVETTRDTHNHPSHTYPRPFNVSVYTLHLVATSALLHTDQRSHSRCLGSGHIASLDSEYEQCAHTQQPIGFYRTANAQR